MLPIHAGHTTPEETQGERHTPNADATAQDTGSLDDIRRLVQDDLSPHPAVTTGGDKHGQFAPVWRWLAQAQHEQRPRIRHPRIALFMAAHGAYPEKQQNLNPLLAQFKDGHHPVADLSEAANADLQVYELDLASPSADFRKTHALTPARAAHAISYGLMCVQPGVDLLAVAALNPVADMAGERIAAALKDKTDPLLALLMAGGDDISAIFGLLVAAQLARVPVVLEGKGALAAGAVLRMMRPDAAAHLQNAADILPKQAASAGLGHASALIIPFLKTLAQSA